MVDVFIILSVTVACLGIYRNFKRKHLIIFLWIIIGYLNFVSLIAIHSDHNSLVTHDAKYTFALFQFLCNAAFYLSDVMFNKKSLQIDKNILNVNAQFLRIYEICYWISFLLTFVELRSQDYNTYNTGNGAGWSQVFFMLTSGIIYYFAYNRNWVKIVISAILMLLIIAVTGVRSLLYFILMPVSFYFIRKLLLEGKNFKEIAKRTIPFLVLLILSAYIVNILRFGSSELPEMILTDIALQGIDRWSYGEQYFMSFLYYIIGFTGPISNMFGVLGIHINFHDYLLMPSIPRLNAMIQANVIDASQLENASHMPATIFYDFYMSWGMYAPIAAFFVYWYFVKVFDLFQKDQIRLLFFSSILGWHFYMLLRGAVDSASSAMGYPLLLGFVVYFIYQKLIDKMIQ